MILCVPVSGLIFQRVAMRASPEADPLNPRMLVMSNDPLDYDDLKALAEELDRPLGTLHVLSSDNDPFMAGREARTRDAHWFGALWRRFNIQRGAHIRRIITCSFRSRKWC
jgi:hypothetical protein